VLLAKNAEPVCDDLLAQTCALLNISARRTPCAYRVEDNLTTIARCKTARGFTLGQPSARSEAIFGPPANAHRVDQFAGYQVCQL
jgi:hypothetical protein